MSIGRLLTKEGLEIGLESNQLEELIRYLRQVEANESLALAMHFEANADGFVDPEEYERAAQAASIVGQTAHRQIAA